MIKKRIPKNKIYLDFVGFTTLSALPRPKEVFGQNTMTINSQEFHNKRAVCLASLKAINTIAFNATDLNKTYVFKVYLQKYLARAKAFVDVLFNVKPKFLGNKISIK